MSMTSYAAVLLSGHCVTTHVLGLPDEVHLLRHAWYLPVQGCPRVARHPVCWKHKYKGQLHIDHVAHPYVHRLAKSRLPSTTRTSASHRASMRYEWDQCCSRVMRYRARRRSIFAARTSGGSSPKYVQHIIRLGCLRIVGQIDIDHLIPLRIQTEFHLLRGKLILLSRVFINSVRASGTFLYRLRAFELHC